MIFETTVSCFESQANDAKYDVATWNLTTAIWGIRLRFTGSQTKCNNLIHFTLL